MRTTIDLTKEQIQKIQRAIENRLEFTKDSTNPDFDHWKLEFLPNGAIVVWSGGYGIDTEKDSKLILENDKADDWRKSLHHFAELEGLGWKTTQIFPEDQHSEIWVLKKEKP